MCELKINNVLLLTDRKQCFGVTQRATDNLQAAHRVYDLIIESLIME